MAELDEVLLALMPPAKFVDPTLGTSAPGVLSGSISTSGTPARVIASMWARVRSPATTMTPVRPAAANRLAHSVGVAGACGARRAS